MFRINDPTYLRHSQYKTSANLAARVNLHLRFSANRYGWMRWVFDQLPLRSGLRVLEVGCGPGSLWRENMARVPPGLHLCLGDLSPGMAQEARQALAGLEGEGFVALDAQALPLPSGSFDIVIANHMLYHLPDLPRGVRELARALKPGGQLCAATNGAAHMRELRDLLSEFDPGYSPGDPHSESFGLENAADRLSRDFAQVEIRRYADALWVTEARPLAEYALSMNWAWVSELGIQRADDLTAFLQARIEAEGGIRITKDAGLVMGIRR